MSNNDGWVLVFLILLVRRCFDVSSRHVGVACVRVSPKINNRRIIRLAAKVMKDKITTKLAIGAD